MNERPARGRYHYGVPLQEGSDAWGALDDEAQTAIPQPAEPE
jgi:hypothetical protein